MKETQELNNSEKWHITQIYRCRQELNRLTAENEPLTSDRMVKLTNRLTDHCLKSHIMSSKNA